MVYMFKSLHPGGQGRQIYELKASLIYIVSGQAGLHDEILSQKKSIMVNKNVSRIFLSVFAHDFAASLLKFECVHICLRTCLI